MSQDRAVDNIRRVTDYCKDLTLRLVRLSKDLTSIEGRASGFLVNRDDDYYLISAGHSLEKSGWIIETDLTIDRECITACIPVNWPWTIKKLAIGEGKPETIDFAWARIEMDSFREAVQSDNRLKGKEFNFNIYTGPLEDSPHIGDPHCYASLNRAVLIDTLGKKLLSRELSYEYYMEYRGTRNDDGLYVFSIPEHQGHEYYEGASGSPIVAPSCKVVSILLGGCGSKNELYGFPLSGFIQLITISNYIEHVAAPDAQNTAPK